MADPVFLLLLFFGLLTDAAGNSISGEGVSGSSSKSTSKLLKSEEGSPTGDTSLICGTEK